MESQNLNTFIATLDKTPEENVLGAIGLLCVKDPVKTDEISVMVTMEGTKHALFDILCDAQHKLLEETTNPLLMAKYKMSLLPVLKAITASQPAPRKLPFWDLIGHLRRLLS